MHNAPVCRCGETAITTISHKPACQACYDKYIEEARLYLPMVKRTFYQQFVYADWLTGKPPAGGNGGKE